MSKTKKVIVVTNAFLISSGIENLVLELRGMLVDHVFCGLEKELGEKIIAKKPEIVIIDNNIEASFLTKLIRNIGNEKIIKTIGLISETTDKKIISKYRYTLNVNDNKYQLVESFKKIIGKEEKPVKTSEETLSKRENEILRHLALGLTNQEIADKLFLSIHTVMTHRKKITKKLGIKTVSGLTVYALMNKLVDIREVERMV